MPSTVVTSVAYWATWTEQQRKTFRNPRGLQRYYVLCRDAYYGWAIFWSADGVDWVYHMVIFDTHMYPSLWIWEEPENVRLVLVMCAQNVVTLNIDVKCFYIDDDVSELDQLWSQTDVGVKTELSCHFPVIALGGNGYLWLLWIDEYIDKGKYRDDIYCRCTTTTYPSSSPSWCTATKVFDGISYEAKIVTEVSVAPLTETADVAIVWAYFYELKKSKSVAMLGKTGSYAGTGVPTFGTEVTFTEPAEPITFSIVAETGNVFVLMESVTPYLICEKWDVSENTVSSFGTVYAGHVYSLSLSIDKTSSPDNLFAFYVRVAGDVNWKVSGVDAVGWGDEETIDDDTESLAGLSSTYEDWNGDSKIQVVYTRQTTFAVRWEEVTVAVPPKLLKYSHAVPIRYIDSYVLIYRNGELVGYRTPYTPFRTERPIQPQVI